MRHILLAITILFFLQHSNAQSKEKIKGSKIVTIEKKNTQPFDQIEILDDLEVFLIKGENADVEIEADDNLQNAVGINYSGSTLILSEFQKVASAKKFVIRIYYTNELKSIVAKNKSKVNILERMEVPNLELAGFDQAKLFVNADTQKLNINADDKSEIQLNTKSESTTIVLGKSANIKALINSKDLKLDMYQKSKANIEGDVENFKLRVDNNINFMGKNLTAINTEFIAEGYGTCHIYAQKNAEISMSGSCEVILYGDPKINLIKFADNVTLSKKSLK